MDEGLPFSVEDQDFFPAHFSWFIRKMSDKYQKVVDHFQEKLMSFPPRQSLQDVKELINAVISLFLIAFSIVVSYFLCTCCS